MAANDRGVREAVSGRSEERQDAVGAPGKSTDTGGSWSQGSGQSHDSVRCWR